MPNRINAFFTELNYIIKNISKKSIEQAIELILKAYSNDKHIYAIGNGGSASTASHIINDLSKYTIISNKKRLKAISLTDNTALITAWANDLSYGDIFVEQIKNILEPEDILLAISVSGRSENICKAADYVQKHNAYVIALTGEDGGYLKDYADVLISVPKQHFGIIEGMHLIISHIIADSVREKITEI